MKTGAVVRNYYILPCLLLLLNLVNNVVSYKAELIRDPYVRTAAVIALVLFGGSVTAFLIAPALEKAVRLLHRSSKQGAGNIGEMLFLSALGVLIFWLYYRLTVHGAEAIVPTGWRNPVGA